MITLSTELTAMAIPAAPTARDTTAGLIALLNVVSEQVDDDIIIKPPFFD
jgi:hypothetical protein